MDKNMLTRFTEDEKAHLLKVWGPMMDPTTFPEADEVAIAVALRRWPPLDREPSE